MTWEEYETFNKVETPDNLYIREHNGTYYTVFELGIASVRRIFELSAADFEEYLKGLRTADEPSLQGSKRSLATDRGGEEKSKIGTSVSWYEKLGLIKEIK
ncbi:hypothetical protein [Streptococcus equi]|uniref:hypothetical protein n=1 Tax=Streptococcus equi TaxID=1336 RepID=UPI001BB716AE|nr:hypothetical protein [Streptococcus equi]QTC11515.1 hypothetical protein HIEAAJJG_00266 [Streptococcus equi subsp. zooepidemicus]